MKVIGINGSPRKNKNTATMLDFALKGAQEQGAEVERIDLFDLNFSGCKSCFACKLLTDTFFGKCALNDDLKPVLEKILNADAVVIASPIYYHDVTGATRNLLERLWFPGLLYDKDGEIAYERRVKVGLIYTMGMPNDDFYQELIQRHTKVCQQLLGKVSVVTSVDAYQFEDYSKYYSSMFDPVKKKERYEKEFPQDCEKAYQMGASLIK